MKKSTTSQKPGTGTLRSMGFLFLLLLVSLLSFLTA